MQYLNIFEWMTDGMSMCPIHIPLSKDRWRRFFWSWRADLNSIHLPCLRSWYWPKIDWKALRTYASATLFMICKLQTFLGDFCGILFLCKQSAFPRNSLKRWHSRVSIQKGLLKRKKKKRAFSQHLEAEYVFPLEVKIINIFVHI